MGPATILTEPMRTGSWVKFKVFVVGDDAPFMEGLDGQFVQATST